MTTLDGPPGVAFRKERVALALLLLAVALALVAERWSAHTRTVETEAERLSGQASAARDVLAQQLLGVRSALLVLADDRADAARLRAFARAVPGVTELLRLDADGRVVASSDPGASGVARVVPPDDPRPGTLYLLAPAVDAAGACRCCCRRATAAGWPPPSTPTTRASSSARCATPRTCARRSCTAAAAS